VAWLCVVCLDEGRGGDERVEYAGKGRGVESKMDTLIKFLILLLNQWTVPTHNFFRIFFAVLTIIFL